MKIAMLNVPYRLSTDPNRWITVPPQGYGGIQWVVSHLMDGLLEWGCELFLFGAPGSSKRPGLTVVSGTSATDVRRWLKSNRIDIIHDHSNGLLLPEPHPDVPFVSTHHLTGPPSVVTNCIYVSRAQRQQAGSDSAPVIALPVNESRFVYKNRKKDYLLFLGRVSRHKGALEAAQFAEAANMRLNIAGPAWESDYLETILTRFVRTVEYVGEVGGVQRTALLADATAVLVPSQDVMGPHGTLWVEPGATVVSEAAVSGTPVIASHNGCLPELVPGVGLLSGFGRDSNASHVGLLRSLPGSQEVRRIAVERWSHKVIAARYLDLYRRALRGERWV